MALNLVLYGIGLIVFTILIYFLIETPPAKPKVASETEDFRFKSVALALKDIRANLEQKDKRIDGLHRQIEELESSLSIEHQRAAVSLDLARSAANRVRVIETMLSKKTKKK
jgi:hypothetical protein